MIEQPTTPAAWGALCADRVRTWQNGNGGSWMADRSNIAVNILDIPSWADAGEYG